MSSVGPLRLTSSQLTVEEAGWWDGGQLGFEPGSAEPRPLPSHTTRNAQHSCLPLGQRRRARCAVRFWVGKAVAGAGRCERGPGVRGWPRSSCTPAVPGCAQVCFLSARSAHRAPGLAELRGLAEGCPDGPGASAWLQSQPLLLLTECWALSAPQVGKGPAPGGFTSVAGAPSPGCPFGGDGPCGQVHSWVTCGGTELGGDSCPGRGWGGVGHPVRPLLVATLAPEGGAAAPEVASSWPFVTSAPSPLS